MVGGMVKKSAGRGGSFWLWPGLAGLGLLAVAVGWLAWQPLAPAPNSVPNMVVQSAADLGGPFTLTRPDGQRVGPQDFGGRRLLIYFGYTFCPDICPLELHSIATALQDLGPLADTIAPVFITVDPQRDTAAALADYVTLFPFPLTALTGSGEEIRAVMQQFRVYAATSQGEDSSEYLVNHSTFLYVTGPDGRVTHILKGGQPPEALAAQLRQIISQ